MDGRTVAKKCEEKLKTLFTMKVHLHSPFDGLGGLGGLDGLGGLGGLDGLDGLDGPDGPDGLDVLLKHHGHIIGRQFVSRNRG